ncbi:uncharacterized protein LOC103361859 [Stegastes partitus]|uniref:Uncharacterized protein LOC103361859 n=1 Tax=Stegastes partitus TaxID=144197 RepID=A0A9Y4N633_9TELE|nr:PREDICTED: uncharacterized protein LOC103361859 [Stegastes partitus]
MMKVSGRVPVCCVTLILVLTSVSAVQRLNSISDLKTVGFGQSVPTEALVLLHWFANTVTIDSYNMISLNFDPDNSDYGAHHYGNYEGLLDPLGNARYRYYTIGNIYQEGGMPLPPHVVRPRYEYAGRNRARIIVRVRQQNVGRQGLQIIDEVYITQHHENGHNWGTEYDPDHTYLVTTNLLRQIRQFPMNGDLRLLTDLRNRFGSRADDSQLRSIIKSWSDLACLGLLLFIVVQEGFYSSRLQYQSAATRRNSNDGWSNDCVIIAVLLLILALVALILGSISVHQA